LTGDAVLVLLVILVILGIIAIASPRYRRRAGLGLAWTVGTLAAIYLVFRGIAEFFIVHYDDPASYHNSWGGPSLAGVFAVHSGPGFLILVGAAVYLVRRGRARRSLSPAPRIRLRWRAGRC
jgi:hypothetical protein